MKKLRMIVRIVTAGLFVLTIVGIVILIINENLGWLDTSYEVIAFSLGSSGMILAVLEQINSHQDEQRFKKMISEINELNREHDDNEKVDVEFQRKLDEILKMDQRIYRKLSKKSKT